MQAISTHELDRRTNDGLEVTLLWEAETNCVKLTVFDADSGDDFELEVDPAKALDAFNHPYAYAASSGIDFAGRTRLLVTA